MAGEFEADAAVCAGDEDDCSGWGHFGVWRWWWWWDCELEEIICMYYVAELEM